MRNPILVTLAFIVLTASAAGAQGAVSSASGAAQGPAVTAEAGKVQSAATPDSSAGDAGQQATASDLGISLDRIRRGLRETPPTKSNLLRYDFHVEVYGTNPKVDFFKDFDLSPSGPVRYGGMTHAEFLNVVTPQPFRAPSADLLSLATMGLQELAKRAKQ